MFYQRLCSKNNENVTCLRIIRKKIVTYGKLTIIKFCSFEVFYAPWYVLLFYFSFKFRKFFVSFCHLRFLRKKS
jgi:hypothetical protein